MSTRCEVLIKEPYTYKGKKYVDKVKLYHHCDGYPSHLGKFLMEHVHPVLQKQNVDVCDIANMLIKSEYDDGFELTIGLHTDIEYFYEINLVTREIKCWKARYKISKNEHARLNKIQEEDLTIFLPRKLQELYS